MTLAALPLITYLWHYLVARLLFDQLIRPIERSDGSRLLLLVCIGAAGFVVGRLTARRR